MLKVCALWCDPAGLDERPAPVKVMFSAPKSSFKHAVDRNRFKRLMRESFRARKAQWTALAEAGASAEGASVLLVAFIFTKIGKTPDGFVLKQPDMQVYIDRAAEKLAKIAGGAR